MAIEIARQYRAGLQNVNYNGHKDKHQLKFQAFTLEETMFYLVYGPVKGLQYDWTQYYRLMAEDQLSLCLVVGVQ